MEHNNELPLSQSTTAILRDMQESMSGEVDAIRNQTVQIESLLKDAIASLHESFESIHIASNQQMKTMTSMMMEVVGAKDEANLFQKAEHASEILTGLVDTLLLSSKNNLNALTTMDALQKRLRTMASLDQEKEALMVRLCECGEREKENGEKVHRLTQQLLQEGDSKSLIEQLCACGEAEKNNGAKVYALTQELHEKQQEQSAYTSKTMHQFKKTHQLIDSTASKDMDEVFSARDKVEEILNHFFQINEVVTNSRVEVNKVNADMRQHLGSAIRALQFEDISTQSLSHTDRHLGRMAGMIAILTDGLAGLDQANMPLDIYIARIASIHAAMSAYHQTLQLEDSNPVSQDSMDEGDIDLF